LGKINKFWTNFNSNSKKYDKKILAKKSGSQEVYYPEIYPISLFGLPMAALRGRP
jgi:hypothetical protein